MPNSSQGSEHCLTGGHIHLYRITPCQRFDTKAEEATRCFAALTDGSQVRMPLAKTFFAPSFGMLTDHFGVSWMVIVTAQ
ncbi:hypothetical protein [Dechloromonas sp. A34]|uniref:hypothetical protein n=1 Tax=Dechloromonas sp. A34 TaxID=447588 RepID=UPI0022489F12|nr:hypothetical protein [Dechloromonas sp. A34]